MKKLLPIGIVAVALIAGSAGVLASSAGRADRNITGGALAVSPAEASAPNEVEEANQAGDEGQKGEAGQANQGGDQGQKGEYGEVNQTGDQGQKGEAGDSPATVSPTK
jgi:hypothetical protein